MKKRGILAILMVCLLLVLTACSGGAGGSSSSAPQSGGSSSSPPAGGSSVGETGVDLSTQEPYTVKIVYFGDADTEDCNEVAALASEITKPLLNTEIELVRIGFGSYQQQMNLMLSSGEKLDLFCSYPMSPPSMAATNQIIPIGDLMEQYGQETLAALDPISLKTTTINGELYGVQSNLEKFHCYGIAMVKDIVEELDIDVSALKTLEDFEDVFAAVADAYPGMYAFVPNSGDFRVPLPYDRLGESNRLGGLENAFDTDNSTVVNLYTTQSYIDFVTTMYDFAQKGYVMPDASSSTETAATLIAAGKGFASMAVIKPGCEGEWLRDSGKEMVFVELCAPFRATSSGNIWWCVAQNSEQPERAVQVLNLMYTNPELANLLANGIEGKHYEYTDDSKTFITLPEGMTSSETGYSSLSWGWPNQQITKVWQGDPENLWEELDKMNREAAASVAVGFSWDNSDVVNELTACANVISKYVKALQCGSLNPEETIPKLEQELNDAGIEKIIESKQEQLDAYIASLG